MGSFVDEFREVNGDRLKITPHITSNRTGTKVESTLQCI